MPYTSSAFTVLGAGSWGTALALLLCRKGHQVKLWGYRAEQRMALKTQRVNAAYLPDYPFPDHLSVADDLVDALTGAKHIVIAVPSFAFRDLLVAIKPHLTEGVRILWGTKGIDASNSQLLHQVSQEILHDVSIAVLSGPSFALEVAAGLPTALVVAGSDKDWLQAVADCFQQKTFRVYINTDMLGVEICGVIKNVLAIAAGISDGMQLGANARSALLTRGLAEMTRLVLAMGGLANTTTGLAGLGDMLLTCTSDLSRNRRLGLALGQGHSVQQAQQQIGQALEGLYNVKQAYQLAQQHHVEMPITEQVYRIIHQQLAPQQALQNLLIREAGLENEQ